MPGRKPQTNRFLILTAVLLCVILGGSFTQSSANPSAPGRVKQPEMFVADNSGNTAFASEPPASNAETPAKDSGQADSELTDEPAPAEVPVKEPVKNISKEKAKKKIIEASPEAATGVWTSSGSSWMFLTDGTPYTGWLTDTDGSRYYFSENGIMQTGWLDIGQKRYYLNLDGILQTGDVTVGGEVYHLKKDGSLKDYIPETAEPEKKKNRR